MGTSIPVVSSTLSWSSRADAEAECQGILRNPATVIGQPIVAGRDFDVMSAILEIHPNAVAKTGVGVQYFFVGRNSNADGIAVSADSVGFWIMRTDGSPVEFSYLESIYPSDDRRKVRDALRGEIRDLRNAFLDGLFVVGAEVRCSISGDHIAFRSKAVVIYEQPHFSQLAYQFVMSEGGWSSISLTNGGQGAFIGDALADRQQAVRWRAFFQRCANLRVGTASESARRPKKIDETYWESGWGA